MRLLRNLLGLGKGPVIAPQVIVVQRFEALAHRNDARARRVQSNRGHRPAFNAGVLQYLAGCRRKCRHVVGVRLGCKVRVLAASVQRIRRRRRPDRALLAVNKGYANTQCAEVDTRHNRH